jgi:O-acetyl-ADP-ribose deacetylase (regulator of RNase III)
MPFSIVRNDITKIQVDAIVNAANTELLMGGGVCGAIFSAAGARQLQDACDRLAPIRTGDAVITDGFALPAKYVIHTAGPVYRGGGSGEEALLRLCYVNSLEIAKSNGCVSVAFPLISSGIYGYPKDEALSVATSAISGWLADNDMDVLLVVFDKAAFMLSQDLRSGVQSFIDKNYCDTVTMDHSKTLSDERTASRRGKTPSVGQTAFKRGKAPSVKRDAFERGKHSMLSEVSEVEIPSRKMYISEVMSAPAMEPLATFDYSNMQLDEPFSTTLLRLIDLKGRTDVDVYKRANLDRKLFSKIRTGKGYLPSKKTIVALAVALELSLVETRNLLEHAGFALSRSVMFDVIVEYFITRQSYDIYEINNVLFEYDQPLLGG